MSREHTPYYSTKRHNKLLQTKIMKYFSREQETPKMLNDNGAILCGMDTRAPITTLLHKSQGKISHLLK
jgi:CMP-N-acetylneuraminic acid synthetase